MKLLIDISDENYSDIINHKWTPRAEIETAISNGVSFDKIRAEIDVARFIDKDTKLCKNANASGLEVALQIIDIYR